MPSNLEMPLYNDLQYTQHVFEAIAFEDYTGRGNYRMIGAIRTQGALTIYTFSDAINADSFSGAMSRVNGLQTSLLPSTTITSFVAEQGVLILGCPACNNNIGKVYMYSLSNLKKIDEYSGSNSYQYLGYQILPTSNVRGSNQFWITSRSSSRNINLHSVVVFEDLDTGKYYAEMKWDLFGFSS